MYAIAVGVFVVFTAILLWLGQKGSWADQLGYVKKKVGKELEFRLKLNVIVTATRRWFGSRHTILFYAPTCIIQRSYK